MKLCIQCNNNIGYDDIFCSECGARQKEATASDNSNKKAGVPVAEMKNNRKVDSEIETVPICKPDSSDNKVLSASDCRHFIFEWNEGASTFLTNTTSSLQFRITPIVPEARTAEQFHLYFKFPGSRNYIKHDLRKRSISTTRRINYNYKPSSSSKGLNQSIDIHFSYYIGKDLYCFEQQLLVDIYPDNETDVKGVIDNLTIKIGEIHQQGKAGDPNINLLSGLYQKTKSLHDLMNKLKKLESWTTLVLYQAIPFKNEIPDISKLVIPPVPWESHKKISLLIGKKYIQLFTGQITLGRSKEADLTVRNEPPEDTIWEHKTYQKMNLNIHKIHCSMAIENNKAIISDYNSTNGTYINGTRLRKGNSVGLEYHASYNVSLAPPENYPRNISLKVRVYPSTHLVLDTFNDDGKTVPAAIVINQENQLNKSTVIVNRWVPLSAVIPDVGNFFITYRENNYALTDGKEWHWLTPGARIVLSSDLIFKVDKV